MDFLILFSILWLLVALNLYLFEIELWFDPYTMIGIYGKDAYPFCFNIRMVSYLMF